MRRNVTELLDIHKFAGCNIRRVPFNMWVVLGSKRQSQTGSPVIFTLTGNDQTNSVGGVGSGGGWGRLCNRTPWPGIDLHQHCW